MIVLVHGLPETEDLWHKVQASLHRDSVALSLPGFGRPRPDGFHATKDEYVRCVLTELERISEPVDLVGTDWGALLTYRIAMAHGDLLRSWVADAASNMHPAYMWHEIAAGLQSSESVSAGTAEDMLAQAKQWGIPDDDAATMVSHMDETMWSSIADLYRSATPNLHADWGPLKPTSAPGLVLHPTDEPYNDTTHASEVAAALGAQFHLLEGTGHFWPYTKPDRVAAVIESFLSRVDAMELP